METSESEGRSDLPAEVSSNSWIVSNDCTTFCKNKVCPSNDRKDQIFKLIALYFLRSIAKSEDFLIGCNVHGAGSFGDILLKIVDSEKNRIRMLHIDYMVGDLQKGEPVSVFKVLQCIKSINYVKFDFDRNEHLNSLGLFDDFEFVFYTAGTIFDSQLWSSCDQVCDVLNTGKDSTSVFLASNQSRINFMLFFEEILLYKTFLENLDVASDISDKITTLINAVHFSEIIEKLIFLQENPREEVLKTLYSEVKDVEELPHTLLSKFRIYCKQAGVMSIPGLIKTELSMLKDLSTLGIEILYKYLLEKIEQWYSSPNYYLTRDCNLCEDFNIVLQKCCNFSSSCLETFLKFELKFFVFPTKDIKNNILNYKVLNVIASCSNMSLTCIKVNQVLESLSSHKYLWITFENFVEWKDDVLNFWLNDCFSILVIECDALQEEYSIVKEISNLLKFCKTAKLIIISSNNRKLYSRFKNIFGSSVFELKDSFRFQDLDDQSQIKVLKRNVIFQGSLVSIGSMIGSHNELKGFLTASIVCKLFDDNTLLIGPSLNQIKNNLIPRSLELSVDFDINVLKFPSPKEIFVVNNISETELRNILHNEDVETFCSSNYEINFNCSIFCVPIQEEGKAFSIICEHFPFKNIHRFVFKNGFLQWKESRGQTHYLKDYLVFDKRARHIWKLIDESKQSKYFPQTLLDSIEHCTIILGESGMGKSTLLNFLQQTTKKENPLNWLIHLNFSGDISLIVKTKKEDYDCEMIIQIIYSLLNYEYHASEIEHILFRHDLEARGNVIIICEGLECVSSKALTKVFDFIHALDSMNIKKLWISSTPNMKSILEKTFQVAVYELQNLTIENQQSHLYFLLENKCCSNDVQKLKDFIFTLQKVCQASKIADIPLLAFPLMCEIASQIFGNEASEYASLKKVSWPDNVDVIQFYDSFIRLKGLQNHKAKLALNASSLSSNELEEMFMNRHMLCALLSLLDIDELNQLHLLDILDNIPKTIHQIEKFEIVEGIVNKKPKFVHRTFAEYFAALWFSQNIEKSREFLKNKLFDLNFMSLLRFFDYFLIRGHELHAAVLKNDVQAVKSLITYGVEVNALDKGGRTALHLAVIHSKSRISSFPTKTPQSNSHDEITELLVAHSTNTKMIDGVFLWRPVQYAITLKKWDAMDLLLREQVSFNDIDILKEKMNDKSFIQEGMLIGSEKGYFNLIECFSSCGINISEYTLETKDGLCSPLHIAAKYGQLKLVRFFLSKKIKVSIKNNKGITPLHLAAAEGMIEVLVYLLQRGADLNCTDKYGNSPLDFAILRGNLQVIILLIEQYHANVNSQNKLGDVALHHAVKTGNITIIEYILMKEAEINICNRDGHTPLHLAVWLGTLSVVKVLLEYKANVNICNKNGDTPLSQNAGGGNLDIVKILVENGADVNKKGDDGNTALHWAARQDNTRVVEFLLLNGADINVQNRYGNTPLHRSVENGCLNTTKLLVNAGSNLQLKNSAGYSVGNIRSRSKEVAECIAYLV